MNDSDRRWSWIKPGLQAVDQCLQGRRLSFLSATFYPCLRVSLERFAFSKVHRRMSGPDELPDPSSTSNGSSEDVSNYFSVVSAPKFLRLFSFTVNIKRLGSIEDKLFFTTSRLSNRKISGHDPYMHWINENGESSSILFGSGGFLKSLISSIFFMTFFTVLLPLIVLLYLLNPIYLSSIVAFSRVSQLNPLSILLYSSIRCCLMLTWASLILLILIQNRNFKTIYFVAGKDVQSMALCLAARLLDVDVCEVQHGLFYHNDYGYSDWHSASKSFCLPNSYAAWCREDADLVEKNFHLPAESVSVIGVPTMMLAEKLVSEGTLAASSGAKIQSSRFTVLICLNPGDLSWLLEILSALWEQSEIYSIVVRQHPDDPVDLSELIYRFSSPVDSEDLHISNRLQFSMNDHLYFDLLLADLVISEWSTVNLEAAYLGVQSIWYGPRMEALLEHSPFSKFTSTCNSSKELKSIIKEQFRV